MHALRDILDQAEKKGVAIGHFNGADLVSLKAVVGRAGIEGPGPGWSFLLQLDFFPLLESVVGGGIGGRLSLNALRSSSQFSQATFVA
jgi:hypothetical protein